MVNVAHIDSICVFTRLTCHTYIVSKPCFKKHLLWFFFVNNFGKCRPIFKILSLSDSWWNFIHILTKILHLTLRIFLQHVVKLKKLQSLPILMAYCMWNLRIHLARYEAALFLSESNDCNIWKHFNSAQNRIRDVGELKQWMIDV